MVGQIHKNLKNDASVCLIKFEEKIKIVLLFNEGRENIEGENVCHVAWATAGLLSASAELLRASAGLLSASAGLLSASAGLLSATAGLLSASAGLLSASAGLLVHLLDY